MWTSKQAAKASKGQREAAEERIIESVSECLHLMGVLKMLMPYLAKEPSRKICDYVLNTFQLAQPMLTMHGVEILIQALQGLGSSKIRELLVVHLLPRPLQTNALRVSHVLTE